MCKKRCGIDEGHVQGMLWYRGGACVKIAAVQRRGSCHLILHVLGEGRRIRCLRWPSAYQVRGATPYTKTKILMREKSCVWKERVGHSSKRKNITLNSIPP